MARLQKTKKQKRNPFYDRFETESDIKQECGTRRIQRVKGRKINRDKSKDHRVRNW